MWRTALGVLLGLLTGLLACGDGSLDPLPLGITLQVSRTTAAPGETINFIVDAQGGTLLGVTMDYGDDSGDQLATGGARTVRTTFSHAFSAAGVYQVRATVTDAAAGSQHTNAQITIQ